MDLRWPPASFWAWMQSASVAALTSTKEAIEQEIANREAQEKAAFLQFWKDRPVPCNRCCRHYTFKVNNVRFHVRISQPILISGCIIAPMNGTDAKGIGSCNLSQVASWTSRQDKDKLQRQPDVASEWSKIVMQRPDLGLCVCVCTVLGHECRGSLPITCCCNFTCQVTCQFTAGAHGIHNLPCATKLRLWMGYPA